MEKAGPALRNRTVKGLILHDIIGVNVAHSYELPTVVAGLRATPNARIRNALAFIRANACHVITVGDVASISGLSRRSLGKSFRTHLGRTVLEPVINFLRK